MTEPSMICACARRHVVGWAFIAMFLGAAALVGCGDDEPEDDPPSSDGGVREAGRGGRTAGRRAGAGAGAGGRGAAGSGSAGRAGTAATALPSVECGAARCESPPAGFPLACCADEATSTCGVSLVPGECAKPQAPAPGCPALDFPGVLALPSCCTPRGMCGIDASSVGVPGCLDLATAAERARMFGASAPFPAPRACPSAEDAGVQDDAGVR